MPNKISSSIMQRVSAIVLALWLLTVTDAVGEARGKRNIMQQETVISFSLTGKQYDAMRDTPCFAEISNLALRLLETSNDTYDMLLNTRQVAEWKKEKDWVEIHFADEKNLHIGYLKQEATVGTILIFFKNTKPHHIVWSGKDFSPELVNIAANTAADKSLYDSLVKCGK